MDVIDLPVVPLETKLTEALDIMKKNHRSGIIAIDDSAHWLFKAGWVVIGIARKKELLRDIEKRCRAEVVEPPSSIEVMGNVEAQDLLDSASQHYMLYRPGPLFKMTRIVTRHEYFAQALSLAPTNCYCTNPDRPNDPHGYNRPLPTGNRCTYDGSPIVCATS
jgi:CBS domain-containing protein